MKKITTSKQKQMKMINNPKSWLERKLGDNAMLYVFAIIAFIGYIALICIKGDITDNNVIGVKEIVFLLVGALIAPRIKK